MSELEKRGIKPEENIRVTDYIDDMDSVIAASDLIISRAGALSVAEILVSGKPSVLIPSPNVTGNHQYFNAKAVADKGGAILIEEKDIDEKSFLEKIRELRNDPGRLERMGEMAHELASRSASDIIYEEIVKDLWKKTNA
jgi:UDP-N-acetylglucosamine--N-acetylmuramyl-(pentapeptide) pyrophosphoryl-undecaprenol N-acetylglucosamine transferase